MSYNGWSNYETWVVKLWMDNDYSDYCFWRNNARQDNDPYSLSKDIQEYYEELIPIDIASMYLDLLNSALSEVNWYEIAESLISDWYEDDTEEEIEEDDD